MPYFRYSRGHGDAKGQKGKSASSCKRFLNQKDWKVSQAKPAEQASARRPFAKEGPSLVRFPLSFWYSLRILLKIFRGRRSGM